MSSPRSKGQRRKPKCLAESGAMQSQVEGFAGAEERTNGHSATTKDLVYAELFADPPSPARNGNSIKKSKPGPLSRKLKLDKKKAAQLVEPEVVETNGKAHVDEQEPQQVAEPQFSEPQISEPQVSEPTIAEPTEFPPTELFEPSAPEPFPEYLPEESAYDDSFASTQIFIADGTATDIEVCVSPSAFPLNDSEAPPPKEDMPLTEEAPVEEAAPPVEAPPLEEVSPPKEDTPLKDPVPVARAFRETPRDYRGFLSVSSRPSIRESTPNTSTPQSFLRYRDDPPTPFVSVFGTKRKAEASPAEPAESKRVRATDGFFARVTAPLYRAFAVKEVRGEEDEGIEPGEEAVEGAEPARKYCVVM